MEVAGFSAGATPQTDPRMTLFDDLRQAFREAVDNFKEELNRDEVSGTVDRLLQGMVTEVTDAKARLKAVEADLEATRLRVGAEEEQVATMERRLRMASDIGDDETAGLATEYLARHRHRLEIFRGKAAALEQEAALLRAEVGEMMDKLQEARASRASLSAEAGRTTARESIGESEDLFDAFRRMEAKISGEEVEADVARDFSDEVDDLRVDPHAPPRRREIDYDAALEELKRRMGKQE